MPLGQMVSDTLTALGLMTEADARLKALRYDEGPSYNDLQGDDQSTANSLRDNNRLTHDEWENAATDCLSAKPILLAPEECLQRLEGLVRRDAFPIARRWFERSTATDLPGPNELCLTAKDESGNHLPGGFPTECTNTNCGRSFLPGERYHPETKRHTTTEEAGYQPHLDERNIYSGSACVGCDARYTQGDGDVLTDISGTQWWHSKRDEEGKITRCTGVGGNTSVPVSKPRPKRVGSGFTKMTRAMNAISVRG